MSFPRSKIIELPSLFKKKIPDIGLATSTKGHHLRCKKKAISELDLRDGLNNPPRLVDYIRNFRCTSSDVSIC